MHVMCMLYTSIKRSKHQHQSSTPGRSKSKAQLAPINLVVLTQQNVVIWPSGQAFCVQIDTLFNLSVTHAQCLKNIMYFYRTYNTIYQNSASTDHFFEVYLLHLVYLEKLENIFARKCILFFVVVVVDYFFKVLCHIQHSCI